MRKFYGKHEETSEKQYMFFFNFNLRHNKYKAGQNKIIFNLKQISRPSLRIYFNYEGILRILGGMRIVILSISSSIMTDIKAQIQ